LKKILLIEDEKSLSDVITLNLELENYIVEKAFDGLSALQLFDENNYNLVILDIMIPKISGFDVGEKIREKSNVPILIISAKGNASDKIKGLKLDANDYLVKPFHLEEFLLRVKNLINLSSPILIKNDNSILPDMYSFGDNHINFKTFEVMNHNGKLILNKTEIELLKFLISNENNVISRDEICEKLWPKSSNTNSRTIDNYILNFRKYFEIDQKKPKHFISIRSLGYKFSK